MMDVKYRDTIPISAGQLYLALSRPNASGRYGTWRRGRKRLVLLRPGQVLRVKKWIRLRERSLRMPDLVRDIRYLDYRTVRVMVLGWTCTNGGIWCSEISNPCNRGCVLALSRWSPFTVSLASD